MAIRTQLRLEQLTGSLDDTVASQAAIAATSLQGVLDQTAAAVKRVHGGSSFSGQAAGVFSQAIKPDSSGGQDLGTTSAEWGDLYLADNKKIRLGADQDVELLHIPDQGVRIEGGSKLFFRDDDISIHSVGDGELNLESDAQMHLSGNLVELEATSAVVVDSAALRLEDDGAQMKFGADDDVLLTHLPDAGLRLTGTTAQRLEIRDDGLSVGSDIDGQLDIKADGSVKVTATNTNLTGDLLVAGNDIDFSAGAANIGASVGGNDLTLGGATTLVVTAGDLKVAGNDIKSSTGAVALTLSGSEVIVPGDLTVRGATTTIDTVNLTVQDKLIGLNYGSGSISELAGDVGFIMAHTGGDTPVAKAFYYDNDDARFKIVNTATSPSGSNITDGVFQDLAIGKLHLELREILNGDAKAIELTTGASPDVQIENHLEMKDDKQVRFGAGLEGLIFHNAAASKLIVSASSATGVIYGVPVSQDHRFEVAGSRQLRVQAGEVEVREKLVSQNGKKLIVSASAGQELQHKSGGDLMFLDVHKPGAWTDADGIKLATNADSWANFRSAFGEVSLLDAVTSAGGGAGTLQKRVVEVTGSGFPAGHTVPLAVDLDALTISDVDERVDIFVNGQLLVSASEVGGNGDYALTEPRNGSAVGAVFQFTLTDDDIVQAVVR